MQIYLRIEAPFFLSGFRVERDNAIERGTNKHRLTDNNRRRFKFALGAIATAVRNISRMIFPSWL
jgi:hypothetical protein